ncbi:hypothetical protein LPB140_05050 [Sphingorhabdus lutea]|uniref:Uncharacterized protein n=1 Tax=Sphingorhabdus lutea TaxID=1913578 RepID=A0A1L3JAV8_9SPHN|nr:hypothetical protein [Sphingorhabdus lutea]APG62274.1 hypothetical protein LPB140_05050 [Sphingorhabdus lutea]
MDYIKFFFFGLVMNFVIGFAVKAYAFHNDKPLKRAILTALMSMAICIAIAIFISMKFNDIYSTGALLIGLLAAYTLPALVHFFILYYQFQMAWRHSDEDDIVENPHLEERKIATLVASKNVDEAPELFKQTSQL